MITRALPFVAMLAATTCIAHAAPLQLGDADLDRIFAGTGSGNGNGNGNIGSNNGNNNQGNNNGNNNVGSNNGNNNNTSNNGNNNNSSNNGNNSSGGNTGNNNQSGGSSNGGGNGNGSGSSDDVLRAQDVLRDALTDIIVFDDGSAADDVRDEVTLRIYRTRLAVAQANEQEARVRRLERRIEQLIDRNPEAAAAADRRRRNGVTGEDLDFVFFSGDRAPNPRRGLQRIIDRGFILYGDNASRLSRFTNRLQRVIYD